jgi:hypothetical protein
MFNAQLAPNVVHQTPWLRDGISVRYAPASGLVIHYASTVAV